MTGPSVGGGASGLLMEKEAPGPACTSGKKGGFHLFKGQQWRPRLFGGLLSREGELLFQRGGVAWPEARGFGCW